MLYTSAVRWCLFISHSAVSGKSQNRQPEEGGQSATLNQAPSRFFSRLRKAFQKAMRPRLCRIAAICCVTLAKRFQRGMYKGATCIGAKCSMCTFLKRHYSVCSFRVPAMWLHINLLRCKAPLPGASCFLPSIYKILKQHIANKWELTLWRKFASDTQARVLLVPLAGNHHDVRRLPRLVVPGI